MKIDPGLCQPASTPMPTQIGCRLGITFLVDINTDVPRPVHVSVERGVTLLENEYDREYHCIIIMTSDTIILNRWSTLIQI